MFTTLSELFLVLFILAASLSAAERLDAEFVRQGPANSESEYTGEVLESGELLDAEGVYTLQTHPDCSDVYLNVNGGDAHGRLQGYSSPGWMDGQWRFILVPHWKYYYQGGFLGLERRSVDQVNTYRIQNVKTSNWLCVEKDGDTEAVVQKYINEEWTQAVPGAMPITHENLIYKCHWELRSADGGSYRLTNRWSDRNLAVSRNPWPVKPHCEVIQWREDHRCDKWLLKAVDQAPPTEERIVPDGMYAFNNVDTGFCVNVAGGYKYGSIQQWDNPGNIDSHWIVTATGNGAYTIKNSNTQRYLCQGGYDENDATRQCDGPEGDLLQLWRFAVDSTSPDRVFIQNVATGRHLNVKGDASVRGESKIVQRHSGSRFRLTRADDPSKVVIPSGYRKPKASEHPSMEAMMKNKEHYLDGVMKLAKKAGKYFTFKNMKQATKGISAALKVTKTAAKVLKYAGVALGVLGAVAGTIADSWGTENALSELKDAIKDVNNKVEDVATGVDHAIQLIMDVPGKTMCIKAHSGVVDILDAVAEPSEVTDKHLKNLRTLKRCMLGETEFGGRSWTEMNLDILKKKAAWSVYDNREAVAGEIASALILISVKFDAMIAQQIACIARLRGAAESKKSSTAILELDHLTDQVRVQVEQEDPTYRKDFQGTMAAMMWTSMEDDINRLGKFQRDKRHMLRGEFGFRKASGFEMWDHASSYSVGGLDVGFGFDQLQFAMQEYDPHRTGAPREWRDAYTLRMLQYAYFSEGRAVLAPKLVKAIVKYNTDKTVWRKRKDENRDELIGLFREWYQLL